MVRGRIVGLACLVAACLIIVGSLATEEGEPESYAKLLGQEIAKLKAEGQPTTLADLNAPPIPDEENAAVLYDKALAKMVPTNDAEGEVRDVAPIGPPLSYTPEQIKILRRHVSKNSEAIELLRRASERPKCRFDYDYSELPFPGGGVTVRQVPGTERQLGPHLREAGRILLAKTFLDKMDGEADAAADSCWLALRMANALRQEPMLMPQLISNVIIRVFVFGGLERVIYDSNISRSLQKELLSELDTAKGREAMLKALAGERACVLDAYSKGFEFLEEHVRRGYEFLEDELGTYEQSLTDAYRDPSMRAEALARDELNYLRWMSRVIAAAKKPYFRAKEDFAAIQQEMSRSEHKLVASYLLVAIASGGHQSGSLGHLEAKTGCLRLVFALKDYKAEHGAYPDSLDKIAKEGRALPVDPFTGKPFLHRKEGDGFIVYSVGSDETDDGGEEPKDIVWRCAR
jgi:hypothetical protein